MSAFKPDGELQFLGSNHFGQSSGIIIRDRAAVLAFIPTDMMWPDLNANREAFARLAFAAPDLFAMVERYASECGECNGTGVVQEFCDASASGISHAYPGRDQPCSECADIRAAISKAGK